MSLWMMCSKPRPLGMGGRGLHLLQPATRGRLTLHKMTLNSPADTENRIRKAHFNLEKGDSTHRVDVSFHQIVFLWLQDQVVSSEGDDSRLPATPGDLREAVGVQASTRQDVPAPHLGALLIQAEQIRSFQISSTVVLTGFFYLFVSDFDGMGHP